MGAFAVPVTLRPASHDTVGVFEAQPDECLAGNFADPCFTMHHHLFCTKSHNYNLKDSKYNSQPGKFPSVTVRFRSKCRNKYV